MPSSPRTQKIDDLLHDLGKELQRADQLQPKSPPPIALRPSTRETPPDPRYCPSNIPEIDTLLGGGFPTGYLSEVTGPASSGRTSLLLALLARATRAGACVAMIDHADAFDPASAAARGVVLDHVLWVRAGDRRAALRATECLLETDGFPLVVLDWASAPGVQPTAQRPGTRVDRRGRARHGATREASIPEAAWLRLTRLAARQQSALLVLSNERIAGSRAAVVLEMQPAVGRFSGSPSLLDELETRAELVRHRVAVTGLRPRARSSAA